MQFLIRAILIIKCGVYLRGNLKLVCYKGKILITQYKNSCNIKLKFIIINANFIF